jgi:hypothetical protein
MKLRRRETGLETELTEGLVIGRAKDCQLSLQEASVSRNHARAEKRAGAWWLVDLKSSNGIACNGQRLPEFELHGGDLITFGSVAFDVIAPPSADDDFGLDLEMPAEAAAPVPAPTADEAGPASQPSSADLERARLRREASGGGRSRGLGDLSQQPTWVVVVVLSVGAVVVYGVGIGVRLLMGMISPTG